MSDVTLTGALDMRKRSKRSKWTSNSREYRILLYKELVHDLSDEMKGLCDCSNHRSEWSLKKARRVLRRYQRNWKQYRKTQWK